MAKDTDFRLYFDKAKPQDPKECQKKDSQGNWEDAPTFNPIQGFFDLLDDGELTAIGSIYRGQVDTTTGEFVTAASSGTTATRSCIIVYVGGTAYKICT